MNIHWIHCIEKFFIIQHFWTTSTCLKKQSFRRNFSLYCLYTFYHSGIFEQLALVLKNRFDLKFFTVLKYFLSFRIFEQLMFALKFFTVLNILFTFMIFEQLALALKNRVALKFFTVLKYFLSFSNFEQLALVLKTGVCTENFHWLKCFLLFRNLEQLALALKTEFALKFFKLGGSSSPPSHTSMEYRGWKYYTLLGKWQFQNGIHKTCVLWVDCAFLVKILGVTITIKKEFTYRWSGRQLDDIFEGGNTVPHENVYIRKTNLLKRLEIAEI